jgi:hypothetical protein
MLPLAEYCYGNKKNTATRRMTVVGRTKTGKRKISK